MTDTALIISALKNTAKGKLQYDKTWYRDGRLRDILKQCTSPPTLQSFPNPKQIAAEKQIKDKTQLADDPLEKVEIIQNDEVRVKKEATSVPEPVTSSPEVSWEKKVCVFEDGWDSRAKTSMYLRRQLFSMHGKILQQHAESQLIELYCQHEKEAEFKLVQAQAEEQAGCQQVQEKQLQLKENHKQHAKRLDATMEAAHKKEQEEIRQKKQKEDECRQRLEHMLRLLQEVRAFHQRVKQLMSGCQHIDYLKAPAEKYAEALEKIVSTVEDTVKQAGQSEVNSTFLQIVQSLYEKAKDLEDRFTKQVEDAIRKAKDEAAKLIQEQKAQQARKEAEQAAATAAAAKASQVSTAVTQPTPSAAISAPGATPITSTDSSTMVLTASAGAVQEYHDYQKKLRDVEKSYEQLLTNPALKKLRFDMQVAVNVPVNAIAPTSGAHLRDKLERLHALLSGQQVEVSGRRVCAKDQPFGINFCKEFFAKKLVKQGDEQVSSNHDSAFAIAAVAIGLWCDYPDLGELILAHFHLKCPYIAPYHIPMKEGQTSEDYYKSLGYEYEEGKQEKQDKFLRRMSGIMRLYAALIVSTPPRGKDQPHPHSLDKGWIWVTRVLNIEPRPDITATLLFDFLEVTGHAFLKNYGKQFVKLVQIIVSDYLPRIRNCTGGSGGPVTRLESFLKNILSSGNIPPPKGLLSPNFWLTS